MAVNIWSVILGGVVAASACRLSLCCPYLECSKFVDETCVARVDVKATPLSKTSAVRVCDGR